MMRAEQHQQLEPAARERWTTKFMAHSADLFPGLLGIVVDDVRTDYCRMLLPIRRELLQGAGIVHGGVLASLLDAVVVPAVGSTMHTSVRFATVDLHVQYLSALVDEDAVAEGWVVKRGRRTAFCESEVRGARSGRLVARALLTYSIADDTKHSGDA
jgi:uncharacterized protein (TIGR00369 family)